MSSQYRSGVGFEHPYSHQIMIGSAIFFFLVWILDSFLFQVFVDIRNLVPFVLRIFLFLITTGLSFLLMNTSQKKIFSPPKDSTGLVSDGIYAVVRHPLYLSIPVLYLAFVFLSFSLISSIPVFITFFFFNWMVEFEEEELVKILGNEYVTYMRNVPRWIPRPKSLWNK